MIKKNLNPLPQSINSKFFPSNLASAFIIIIIFTGNLFTSFCFSDDFNRNNLDTTAPKYWTAHFQQTFVEQYHPPLFAKYSGINSLDENREDAMSMTSSLFLGVKVWNGGEIYFNPEVAGGRGLSKAQGLAGFSNNEIVRVGAVEPVFYPARLFYQQIFNLNDSLESFEDDVNQISTKKSANRIEFRIGKFSIIDYFDKNSYSHDGRAQFINWSLVKTSSE